VNRKIDFANSKYVALDNPYHLIMYNGTRALPILPLKWPIYIAFIEDRSIKFGSKFGKMDFCTNLMLKVQKGHGLGPRDQISKFWDPL